MCFQLNGEKYWSVGRKFFFSFCHLFICLFQGTVVSWGLNVNRITIKSINGPGYAKVCIMPYANNKGADQPAHPRSLISTFVVRCLDTRVSQ